MNTFENAQVGSYELAVIIEKPRQAVWKAITAETNNWWLPSFHLVGEGSVVSMHAEAGGHLIEKREGGGSMLWCTVDMVDPGKSIHFFGHKEWGGASVSQLTIELEDHPSGCRVVVSESHIGHITEKHLTSLRDGYMQLFTDGLKRYCEKG